MGKWIWTAGLLLASTALSIDPALAHHVMGGRVPETFADGLLSGLAHPIIGLDHFAAIVAVACLASAHRAGPFLVVGFVVAMIAGVTIHVRGTTLPVAEIIVALSVIVLGAVLLRNRSLHTGAALALFIAAGLTHGYALGETIYGSETSPLAGYFIGLVAIQSAVALSVMFAALTDGWRRYRRGRADGADPAGHSPPLKPVSTSSRRQSLKRFGRVDCTDKSAAA
jgi:urease accessory protein